MIDRTSTNLEWIEEASKKHKKADKILVEKVVRALLLLESLSQSDISFCFKGGTCAMLMMGSSRRMSIDIDIIAPMSNGELQERLEEVAQVGAFNRCEPIHRTGITAVPKEHYKFYYISAVTGKENSILLDVLREDIHYTNTRQLPVESDFVKSEGNPAEVTVPDFDNIIADKLTAFAPNTTGIPYVKNDSEMGMEIMKQMYDIGSLFDFASDISVVKDVFTRFCKTELDYRRSKASVEDVLDDAIKTALAVCLRRDIDDSTNFTIIVNGVKQVNSHIFSESFNLDTAVVYAAKAACLASALKCSADKIDRFDKSVDMSEWIIEPPLDTKLNKIKKAKQEAFFYLWQMSNFLKE